MNSKLANVLGHRTQIRLLTIRPFYEKLKYDIG
jgi:hypothetical protein